MLTMWHGNCFVQTQPIYIPTVPFARLHWPWPPKPMCHLCQNNMFKNTYIPKGLEHIAR